MIQIHQIKTDSYEKPISRELMKMTGLSRGDNNTTVRKEIDDAVQNKAGIIDLCRSFFDREMDGRFKLLEQHVR